MVTPKLARLMVCLSVAVVALFVSCRRIPTAEQSPAKGGPPASTQPSPSPIADDGQWLMAAKNYANTRFSGLSEITADNVATLKPVWTFSTGVLRGHEGAPLVVGDTMFIVTPYPNNL